MSRKPEGQKRPIESRGSRRSLNRTPVLGTKVPGARARRYGSSRRAIREPRRQWFGQEALVGLILLLTIGGSGLLAWQVHQTRSELGRELEVQNAQILTNQKLMSRRQKLLAKEEIIPKAAVLGLYPPRAQQIRKLGGR